MGNAARKARKAAKEPFVRKPKVGTKLTDRYSFHALSMKGKIRALEDRGAMFTTETETTNGE
jgi:hypothetical protein